MLSKQVCSPFIEYQGRCSLQNCGIVHPGIDVHFDIVFLNDHCGIVLHDGVFKLFVNVDR